MYCIEIMTTRQCNMGCSYCTTAKKMGSPPEVDIDYLKYVLDCLPSGSLIEFTGGEIGLLYNLDETFQTIYDHKNVDRVRALSNGLIRKLGVDWLDKVEYWEHLIHEIDGWTINKFYDLDLDGDHRYVIVTTEKTTKSLLEHWDYFEGLGIFKDNFFFKLMNHKSPKRIDNYKEELLKLYSSLDELYFIRMILTTSLKTYLKKERELCEFYSPNQFVDLETKEIGHCAINVNESDRWEFNESNLNKLMNGYFMRGCDYCKTCYSFDSGKNRNANNNRSYTG